MGCSGSTPNLSKRQRRSKRGQEQSHKEQQETNNESTNYRSDEEESRNPSPVLPPHFGHHIIHHRQNSDEQQQSHPEPGRGGVQEFSFLSSAPTTDLLRPHQQNQFKNGEFMERSNLDRHDDMVASQDRKHLPRASAQRIHFSFSSHVDSSASTEPDVQPESTTVATSSSLCSNPLEVDNARALSTSTATDALKDNDDHKSPFEGPPPSAYPPRVSDVDEDDIAEEWSGLFFSDGAEQLVGNGRTDNNPLSIDGFYSNKRDGHDDHNRLRIISNNNNNHKKTSTPSVSPASGSHTPWDLSSRTQTFQGSSPSFADAGDGDDNLFSDENEAYEACMQRMAEFESESSNNSSFSDPSSF